MAGLVRPSTGEIIWAGEDHFCGLSAPDAPVYRELTAIENLAFFGRARRQWSEAELRAHLAEFELGERAQDLAGELSSGLRARLQLAVATWHRPSILLLDEPGANLDEAGRALLSEIVTEQRARGITLLATNDAREAELADRRVEL